MKAKILIVLGLLLLNFGLQAKEKECIKLHVGHNEVPENLIEKKKSITHTHHLSRHEPVHIDNHFGDVKVRVWEKPEVKVNIEITANAPSEKKVQAFLEIVKIHSEKVNGEIHFKTDLQCLASAFENNINGGDDKEERNFLRVDYEVWMPEGHDLTVENSHGDVYIPRFLSVLNLHQNYGNLFADHLKNERSVIDLNFGKGFIKSMKGGQLNARQTALLIDKAENVVMTNTSGNVKVLMADHVDMKTSYGSGHIDKVSESCRFQVKYAKEFILGEIMADVDKLEIESSHTNLELPLCVKGRYDLSTNTRNTDLVLKDQPKVHYIATGNDAEKRMLIGTTTETNATKVRVTSSYGRVEVK
jgi:hypothetical protein